MNWLVSLIALAAVTLPAPASRADEGKNSYGPSYGSPRLRDSDCPKYIASLIDNLVKRSDKPRECIPS